MSTDPRGPDVRSTSMAIPAILVIVGGTAYGSMFAANKIAIGVGFPFIAYTFWQALFAGAALLVFGALRADVPQLSFAHLRHYVLMSVLGIVIPLLVLTYIADKVPAGVVTLIIGLTPPLTYVFAFLLRREGFRWLSVGGVVLGFASLLLIVVPAESLSVPGAAIWMVVALAVPISVATNIIVMAYWRPPETSTLSLVCGLLVTGAVITGVIMLAAGGFRGFWAVPSAGFWAMLWAGAVQAIAFLTGLEVARRSGPVYVAQMNYVIVGAGFLWALALFDEDLSVWVWAALATMLMGLALTNAGAARAQRQVSPSLS